MLIACNLRKNIIAQIMLFDTHCHLNYHNNDELRDIINNAKQAGLGYVMQAGTNIEDINREIEICKLFTDENMHVFCALAKHPEHLKDGIIPKKAELKSIIEFDKEHIKAIGETGLDTHIQENELFFQQQIKSLEEHIETAIETNMPIIIHSRGDMAVRKSIEILHHYQKNNKYNIKAVYHSYTGSTTDAKSILDCGFNISFSGISTFKNANEVRDVVKITPIDSMFVETDAPFLAPTPMRGKQNQTGYVYYVAEFLSNFLQIDFDIFCNTTTNNAKKFFNII